MPDCTRRDRPIRLILTLFCALVALAAGVSSQARADGDPASDVLASQLLFAPADGGFAQSSLAQLNALLAAVQRQGMPIRTALIASPGDLGSVGELWRKPQRYAQFLGQELSEIYPGVVLVVMPNGVGMYKNSEAGSTASVVAVAPRASLTATAVEVVQGLAAAAGHPLHLAPAAARAGSSSWLSSVDLGSWLALAAGAALIATVWAASLRARPPRRLRRAR